MSKGKPTSIDIAYLTGFSQATVSRALRDSPLAGHLLQGHIESSRLYLPGYAALFAKV